MSTTSRRLSQRYKVSKNVNTPGRTKGGFCVRPRDFGIFTKGNPYKGQGMAASVGAAYVRIGSRYSAANKGK